MPDESFRLGFNPGDPEGAPPLIFVDSSNVESWRWWDESVYGHTGAAQKGESTLEVWFKARPGSPRRGYYYYNVSQSVWLQLQAAASKGGELDRLVKKAGLRYQPI